MELQRLTTLYAGHDSRSALDIQARFIARDIWQTANPLHFLSFTFVIPNNELYLPILEAMPLHLPSTSLTAAEFPDPPEMFFFLPADDTSWLVWSGTAIGGMEPAFVTCRT